MGSAVARLPPRVKATCLGDPIGPHVPVTHGDTQGCPVSPPLHSPFQYVDTMRNPFQEAQMRLSNRPAYNGGHHPGDKAPEAAAPTPEPEPEVEETEAEDGGGDEDE